MNLYLAPLEGITGHIFRSCQLKHFGGVDKYFTPFITPSEKGVLGTKYLRDILPENNVGQNLVPQILTNSAKGFVTMCKSFEQYGYDEFNLNLGCPSGTVVSKGRGSGFLAHTDELDAFLNNIFKSDLKISVKTRIGVENPNEFYKLLEIYNQYPISELIIHPRTRKDMYKNFPDFDMYAYAEENSKNKLCYNGDIFDASDYKKIVGKLKNTDTVMIGRGVIANPALPAIIKNNETVTKDRIKAFYYDVYDGYKDMLSGNTPLMYKMKELLLYMSSIFKESEKIMKKVKKAKNITDLNSAVNELFSVCDVVINQ
jgi:tRNA-dihydrouridine synthase